MITVKRPPVPDFLTEAGNKWSNEIDKAIAHYSAPVIEGQFKFLKYRAPELKTALKAVFTKCAYCESIYAHVYDGDIEHFRPKGKVNEKYPQTPGYYWLANDWDNLLLSCLLCNQSRRHVLYGETVVRARGKLDQFPLSDESKRIYGPGQSFEEEEKVRLLLNPCKDNPEVHFQYDISHAVMIPVTEMGRVSLDIYVLQRPDLVESRQKKLALIMRQVGRVKRELELFNQNPTGEQKGYLKAELEYLFDFTSSNSEYAGMARYIVRKFLTENNLTPG